MNIAKSMSLTGNRAFIGAFFKKFPQYKLHKPRRLKDFSNIIRQFHSDLIEAVVNNRFGADLPLKSGNLKIISYKKNRNYLNYHLYKSQGVITTYSNNHSDGLSCKIVYSNKSRRYKLKDKSVWEFRPSRRFQHQVSEAFNKSYSRYIFSPNRGQIEKKHDAFKWKNLTDESIEKYLQNYNEFDL